MKFNYFHRAVLVLTAGFAVFHAVGARAEADAAASISFPSLMITPEAGIFTLTSLSASAFAQAGVNNQFNSGPTASANANGDFSTAFGSGITPGSLTLNVSGSASSAVSIPGQTVASDAGTGRGTVIGSFTINGGVGQVNTTFSLTDTGSLFGFTDVYGQSASAETIVSLELNGNPILFDDQKISIGSSSESSLPVSTPLTTAMELTYGQSYSFVLEADAETFASNVPEPGAGALLAAGLSLLWLGRIWSRRRAMRRGRAALMLAAAALPLWFVAQARASYIGADAPDVCQLCGFPPTRLPAGNAAGSLSEGNLQLEYPVGKLFSSTGPTIDFNLIYNTYNADASKAQVDTGLGLGWSHSYNIYLFSQRSHMFKMGAEGRVTQYRYSGGPVYTTDAGYFETLTQTSPGNFALTNKNKSWWLFGTVPNTPFLVAGPVYRLLQMGDRNNNVTVFTYDANGLLSTITDTYGRSLTLAYGVTGGMTNLASVTDPLGRTTSFTYDGLGRMPTTITDPLGRTTQYTYNSLYQMTRMVDRDGRTYMYMFRNERPFAIADGSGQPYYSLTNGGNWAVNSSYLALMLRRTYVPNPTIETDGRGNVWSYQYDTNGYLLQTTAPDSTTTTYTYDPTTLQMASKTDADGHTTTYQYDPQGNRTNITDALGDVTTYTYEPVFNQMTGMTDPSGRTTTYTYDGNGNRLTEVDPLTHTNQWTYDGHGNVTSFTDRDGHTTIYQYDPQGNRTNMTDALGDVTSYQYDAVGNRISMTDADNHTTQFQYDALNRVITTTNAAAGVTIYRYDPDSRLTNTTDPDGHTTSYQYDTRGRLLVSTNAIGGTTSYTYDANDNRLSTTDPLGRVTSYQYDSQNRTVTNTDPLGGVTSYTYDPVGNRLSTTDANTNTTTYTYDAINRRVTLTDPLGGVTQYDYAVPGGPPCCTASVGSALVTRLVDADGHVTFYKYDELNRQVNIIRNQGSTNDVITPSDAVTTYTYDPVGNRLTETDPVGNTTSYGYDAVNRLIAATNAAGDVTTTTYDGVGNRISITSPNGNITTNSYDTLDRVIKTTDGVGTVSTNSYDAVGNLTHTVDGNSNITTYTYDGLDRRIAETDPLGHTTTTTYDAVGNRTNITDRLGHTTSYMYDGLNRRTSQTDALGNVTTYTYDPVGNQTGVTDPNGHTTSYMYDSLNRRITTTLPDPVPNTITYQYDPVGNLTNRTDQRGQVTAYSYSDLYYLTNRLYQPSGTNDSMTYDLAGRLLSDTRGGYVETYTYDGANRVTSATENGRTLTYVYDIQGRTQTNTYPSGRVINLTYDARNRLLSVSDTAANPPLTTYTYDAADRVLTRTNRNTTSSTYTYDADDRLSSIEHSNTLGRIAGYGYAYDFEGNRLYEQKRHATNDSETYQYDADNRLTAYDTGVLSGNTIPSPATNETWTLDGVGNWLAYISNAVSQARSYGPANELTNINSTALTYDADGNLARDTNYIYSYDEENRLTQVQRISDSAIVGRYIYDALGRRVIQIMDPAGTVSTNIYFYDHSRIIEQQDGAGSVQATYTYGVYVDDTLTMDRGGQTYYYHRNALWSPGALTDATGAVVERYAYDAYGQVVILNAGFSPLATNSWGTQHSAVGNEFLFTGRQLDEETGLYHYRARFYDPEKGRFLQRDPRGDLCDVNLYLYVQDNPICYTDPTGLAPQNPDMSKWAQPRDGALNQTTTTGDGRVLYWQLVAESEKTVTEFLLVRNGSAPNCCRYVEMEHTYTKALYRVWELQAVKQPDAAGKGNAYAGFTYKPLGEVAVWHGLKSRMLRAGASGTCPPGVPIAGNYYGGDDVRLNGGWARQGVYVPKQGLPKGLPEDSIGQLDLGNAFSQAPPTGGESSASASPQMMGD